MLAAEPVFIEGRQAVIDRATAVIASGSAGDPVPRFARRRLLRPRRAEANANVPDTRLDAIRFAAAFVGSNHAVLDAAEAGTPETLDPTAAAIEAEVADLAAESAIERMAEESTTLLHRLQAQPDLAITPVYPVARDASDLAGFIAVELHLIARMLDSAYEPTDSKALMSVLNESLRSMLGHGLEDWVSERMKPWRQMVIRRGLAWP